MSFSIATQSGWIEVMSFSIAIHGTYARLTRGGPLRGENDLTAGPLLGQLVGGTDLGKREPSRDRDH